MIKKTIKYTDYNGVERTEDYYFHLSKAEITEMELSVKNGFVASVKRMYETENVPEIAKIFKDLILRSYGEKSIDGRSFIKEREGRNLSDDFKQTAAYSELYMELIRDTDKAIAFINGLVPEDIAKAAAAEAEKKGISLSNPTAEDLEKL